jgi:hypothetical protein
VELLSPGAAFGLASFLYSDFSVTLKSIYSRYKAAVRSVLTYGCDSRAEKQKTKQTNETTEMKVLRNITQKSLGDTFRSSVVKEDCKI